MARAFILVLLWFFQLVLVLLLVNADWIEKQANVERASVTQQFGALRHADMEARADAMYERWFVVTNARQQSYARLLPDRSSPENGMQDLAPWFFRWLEERLDAFWLLVFQALCRVQVLREWGVLLLVTLGAAVLDGQIQRRIKRANHALASADKYLVARRTLLALLFAPLLYLSVPIAVVPVVVPAWGAALALVFIFLVANAQHHI